MTGNRGELYGDGFFETMYCKDGSVPLLDFHVQRIYKNAEILEMQVPVTLEQSLSTKEIALKFPLQSYRLRLDVFRKHGQGYSPLSQEALWTLQGHPLLNETHSYSGIEAMLNIQSSDDLQRILLQFSPLRCSFSTYVKFADEHRLSEVKSLSSLLYVMASTEMKKKALEDVIILNQFGRVCETSRSNLFVFFEGKIYSPPLSEGPIDGVARAFLRSILKDDWCEMPLEKEFIQQKEVLVFCSNALRGITRLNIA